MNIKRTCLIGLCLLFASASNAQWTPSAAFNAMAPQHRDWRITGQPDHGYLSFLNNGSCMASNTLAHPATWIVPGSTSSNVDLAAVLDDFAGSNALEGNASLTLFNVGFFLGEKRNSFVDIAATEHIQARLGLPGDLLRLPFTGNATFDGASATTIDLSPLEMHLLHYRAFSAGVKHTVGERLSVAARIERLQGVHHLAIEENRWGLVTDANDWSWILQGGGRIVSSGMHTIYQAHAAGQLDSLAQALPQRLTSTANTGWGAQAGIEMDWSPRLSTWIQFNHGGSIRWTNDVLTYEVEAFEWELDGFDATNGGDGWIDGTAALADSLKRWANQELSAIEAHHAASVLDAAYVSKLPNRLVVGAECIIRRGDRGGYVSLGGMVERLGKRPMSWNVAINARIGNGLQSTLTYGNRFGLATTAGVSVAMPLGPLLVFASAEGHQALDWSHFSVEHEGQYNEWSMPTEAPYVAAQAGVVWRLKWRKPKPAPQAEPLAPFQNSTRSPSLGFNVQLEDGAPEAQPCALPGEE